MRLMSLCLSMYHPRPTSTRTPGPTRAGTACREEKRHRPLRVLAPTSLGLLRRAPRRSSAPTRWTPLGHLRIPVATERPLIRSSLVILSGPPLTEFHVSDMCLMTAAGTLFSHQWGVDRVSRGLPAQAPAALLLWRSLLRISVGSGPRAISTRFPGA